MIFGAKFLARPYYSRDVANGNHKFIITQCNMASSSRKKCASAKSGGLYCVAGGPNLENCKNSTSMEGISMHLFPADVEIKKKWVDFVRRHRPNFEPTRYSALCSIHFEPSSFHQRFNISELGGKSSLPVKRRLERDVIPSIYAANESPFIEAQKGTLSKRSRRQVCKLFYTVVLCFAWYFNFGISACVSGM